MKRPLAETLADIALNCNLIEIHEIVPQNYPCDVGTYTLMPPAWDKETCIRTFKVGRLSPPTSFTISFSGYYVVATIPEDTIFEPIYALEFAPAGLYLGTGGTKWCPNVVDTSQPEDPQDDKRRRACVLLDKAQSTIRRQYTLAWDQSTSSWLLSLCILNRSNITDVLLMLGQTYEIMACINREHRWKDAQTWIEQYNEFIQSD